MKIPKKYQYGYIVCLPEFLEKQTMEAVKKAISEFHLNKEEKEKAYINALCSKVCDLEDTIEIEYVEDLENVA